MFRASLLFILIVSKVWSLKIHGNWCGPYHPTNTVLFQEQVPHPVNFTDISCRLHDFNYINYDDGIKPDQVNAWYKIYPYEQQLEVDRLLIRDIEWGLEHSNSWDCKASSATVRRHDFSAGCNTPKLTLSKCSRSSPTGYEILVSRVIQMAIWAKVATRVYLGSPKSDYKVCSAIPNDSFLTNEDVFLNFERPMVFMEETPSFCEIQSDFSDQAMALNNEEIAHHLKVAFRYFDGRSSKITALKGFHQLLRDCETSSKQDLNAPLRRSNLSHGVFNRAFQFSLEEEYRFYEHPR